MLRALWAEPVVTFNGRWHTIEAAGLNPLPVRRSIPLWIGGYADVVLDRAGRLADGWFPAGGPSEKARADVARMHAAATAAGRDPAGLGIEPRLSLGQLPEAEWLGFTAGWADLGATHLSVNTMGMGFSSPDQHVAALRRAAEALGLVAA